jgi:hypothetical protein
LTQIKERSCRRSVGRRGEGRPILWRGISSGCVIFCDSRVPFFDGRGMDRGESRVGGERGGGD